VILLALTITEMLPIIVFMVFVALTWLVMSLLSKGKTQAEERLDRIGRSRSTSRARSGDADR
jgi:hypothetical protein